MKKPFIFALAMMMFASLMAQTVKETQEQFGEYLIPAYSVSLTQSKDVVTSAVNQRLKDASVKPTTTKGYIAVLNQTFAEIYSQPVDFYAKVTEEGKKKDRVTVVTFFAKSPNLTISQNELNINVQRFAEGFPRYVEKIDAQMRLSNQGKALEKNQKSQAKAVAALEGIDKAIAKDEEKIAKKQAEIEKYNKKIADLQKDIDKLNSDIEKQKGKRGDAQEKVDKANSAVQSSEDEMNRIRQESGTME